MSAMKKIGFQRVILVLFVTTALCTAIRSHAAEPGPPSTPRNMPHPTLGSPFAGYSYFPYALLQFQWMNRFAQHFMGPMMDEVTRFEVLNAMMQAVNPQRMFGLQAHPYTAEGGEVTVPDEVPLVTIPGFPTQSQRKRTPNTVTGNISIAAKRNFYQTMMMMSPLSMRDMIGVMADKMAVADDVSFEDAVDSMKLRANEINFKFVGHSPLWKDVSAITGDEDTPRVEIFYFCDAVVARKILDYVPEFVVFLPCRIALLEDAQGKLWVMTLDWDVNWLNYAQNPNSVLDKDLRADATRIREGLRYIMEGAATGDF